MSSLAVLPTAHLCWLTADILYGPRPQAQKQNLFLGTHMCDVPGGAAYETTGWEFTAHQGDPRGRTPWGKLCWGFEAGGCSLEVCDSL